MKNFLNLEKSVHPSQPTPAGFCFSSVVLERETNKHIQLRAGGFGMIDEFLHLWAESGAGAKWKKKGHLTYLDPHWLCLSLHHRKEVEIPFFWVSRQKENFSFLNTDAVGQCHSSDASLSLGAARAAPISWPLHRYDGNEASSHSLVASPQSSRPGEGGPGQGWGEGNDGADAALKKTQCQQRLLGKFDPTVIS